MTRAQETLVALRAQQQELEHALEADVAAIEASCHPSTEPLELLAIRPTRAGVQVQLVALAWR